jgi:hypothetical protein
VLLHQGRPEVALERLVVGAGEAGDAAPSKWIAWIWLHWYVALRAEAAVLAGAANAARQVTAARAVVGDDPLAGALVGRAEALLAGDRAGLLATEAAFAAAGCPYQAARTLVLAGGDRLERGHAALGALGLAPS